MNDEQNVSPTVPEATKAKKFDNNKTILFILLAFILVAGLLGLGFWGQQQSSAANKARSEAASLHDKSHELSEKVTALEKELADRKETTGEVNLDKTGYQSVFLKSGQVYFGKITAISENQVTLENIYYLRENGGGDTSLVKLGSELHGPQDKMFIERKELSFWENLKNDSEVVKAIAEYEKANP